MFSKFQKSLVGNFCKCDDNDVNLEWFCQVLDSGMVLLTNNQIIVSMPLESCFLRLDHYRHQHRNAGADLEKLVKSIDATTDRHLDKLDQIEIRGRDKLQLLTDDTGTIYKVNTKYLDYFDEFTYEMLGSSPKAPIVIKFLDDVLGVILPVV